VEKQTASLTDRILRAGKLDPHLYEEVERDSTAMGQAVSVVVLSSVAAGIGTMSGIGFRGIFLGTFSALAAWFVWAFIIYFVGTKILPTPQTHVDIGQLLRTIGFASAPGIIRVLGVIPFLAGILFFVASIWMLMAMVIAVRQALDYQSTWRAVAVCLIGWGIQVLILFLLLFAFR
jgi:hypothetical protein